MPRKTARTQQQRREQTRQVVLASARHCFAQQGYQATSLDDIAAASGLTSRPIYHYFGNKLGLFTAVADQLENELADAIRNIEANSPGELMAIWHVFIQTCRQHDFRRIVLLEAPIVLGRERWQNNQVVQLASDILDKRLQGLPAAQKALITRMLLVALAEAALLIGEAEDSEAYIEAANRLADTLLGKL